eukprot:CAMPEP_0198560916 /NCGR_PEP_ID=MMETSP1462-20131121/94641_1 /TAXON_ID=1333877 /ORGANISM="Brandtodinium nutriculum, Strain RCC3387" /LENGTH=50 /DNA_ID=CAMNT_0044291791 /DNA_START=30 /DNA_END=178 /DNA_ORIENTATION=-
MAALAARIDAFTRMQTDECGWAAYLPARLREHDPHEANASTAAGSAWRQG